MALKLWTNPANFRAFKVLIAAEYNGVELEVPEFNHPSDSKSPDFLAKSPLGRVPVLETPQVRKQVPCRGTLFLSVVFAALSEPSQIVSRTTFDVYTEHMLSVI